MCIRNIDMQQRNMLISLFIIITAIQNVDRNEAKLSHIEQSSMSVAELSTNSLYTGNNVDNDDVADNIKDSHKEQMIDDERQNSNKTVNVNAMNRKLQTKMHGHKNEGNGKNITNIQEEHQRRKSNKITTTILKKSTRKPAAKIYSLFTHTTTNTVNNGNDIFFPTINAIEPPLLMPQTKFNYPSGGFINPFGQLVAFFGSDQLHLQDYNFLFNAERHTVFHLHTSQLPSSATTIATTTATMTTNEINERMFNVVTGSIGAVFGVASSTSNNNNNNSTATIRVEEIQLYKASSLKHSHFNPFNPTRILVHGWFGGLHSGVYNTLVPEYLKVGNYNVITVDWGRGAIADYITASYRVKPVAKVVAKFIDFMHQEAGMQYEDLHVIGFSMGAHIAGIAGKFVLTGRLPVIYALDPALPFFRFDNVAERVAYTDADYVEVIHTSAGSYGYDHPLGHADFYVNYGSNQPGCFLNECSHFRAFQVFAESLTAKPGFVGQGCDAARWKDLVRSRRCLVRTGRNLTMGGDPLNTKVLRRRLGVFHVTTNASPPYARA